MGNEVEFFLKQDEYDENGFGVGCAWVNDECVLCLFNKNTNEIIKIIPEKYQQTPICVYPFCGGLSEGLIMVSEMGEIELQYYHHMHGCAGLWGWLDLNMNVVIKPKYLYALNFCNGRAIVCKGEWSVKNENEKEEYWCENEQWGVIDCAEREIVPCRFDEINKIDETEEYYLVHEGGWENGTYAVYGVKEKAIVFALDFDFDMGYMFNQCFVIDDRIFVFNSHISGEEKDIIDAYDLMEKRWIVQGGELEGREFNGQTRSVIYKDGKEIIVF